jgi:urease accessory protein UreF
MRSRAALYALADGRMAAGGFTPTYGFEAAGITDLRGLRMHLLGRLYGSLRADRAIATETCRLGPPGWDRLAWEADVRAASVSQRELARSRGQMLLRFGRRIFTDAGIMLPDELPEPVAIGAIAWFAQANPEEADALTLYTGIAGPVWTAVRILSLDPTDAAALIVDLCAAAPPPAPAGHIPAATSPLGNVLNELNARRSVRGGGMNGVNGMGPPGHF